MSYLPLIEKIKFLESELGQKTVHPILEPFKFDSANSLQVQLAGKKIAQHIGLTNLTFVITYATQKSNVGGHIQLDDSNDVFIEIDSTLKDDHEIVLAILAHEICHKYLYLHKLKLYPEYENEMLTDAATIYTGLGKLSLNGCEKEKITRRFTGGTTISTTTTNQVGYMNREQFAFVYRLICEMRNIPKSESIKYLSSEARDEVRNVSLRSRLYFNKDFFKSDFISKKLIKTYKKDIDKSYQKIARFDRYIREIQDNILPTAQLLSKDFHSYTKTKGDLISEVSSSSVNEGAHTYINNLYTLKEFDLYKDKVNEMEYELRSFNKTFEKLIVYLKKKYFKKLVLQDDKFLFQFNCPSCKNKMRIGEKKLARITCKKCNYNFIVDTGILVSKKIDFNKFWSSIISLFKNKNE